MYTKIVGSTLSKTLFDAYLVVLDIVASIWVGMTRYLLTPWKNGIITKFLMYWTMLPQTNKFISYLSSWWITTWQSA